MAPACALIGVHCCILRLLCNNAHPRSLSTFWTYGQEQCVQQQTFAPQGVDSVLQQDLCLLTPYQFVSITAQDHKAQKISQMLFTAACIATQRPNPKGS
jgi:hypothetical protein